MTVCTGDVIQGHAADEWPHYFEGDTFCQTAARVQSVALSTWHTCGRSSTEASVALFPLDSLTRKAQHPQLHTGEGDGPPDQAPQGAGHACSMVRFPRAFDSSFCTDSVHPFFVRISQYPVSCRFERSTRVAQTLAIYKCRVSITVLPMPGRGF